jgi:hypothetical protein
MSLDQLDAMIDATPGPGAVVLTEADWVSTMRDPAAAPAQAPTPGGGYTYRGLRVLISDEWSSCILDAEQARAEGLVP